MNRLTRILTRIGILIAIFLLPNALALAAANDWTFRKGAGDYVAEFGVYDDPTPANNIPGSRRDAATWRDASGNLWLFGGEGLAAADGCFGCKLNDLWKYDPSTNNWTFIRGAGDYLDESGVYNDPTPANNYPGSRFGAAYWTDANGDFWLFGGEAMNCCNGHDKLNDLWKYDPDTNIWTFVKGSSNSENVVSVYNDANPANNTPGPRQWSATWVDANGDFWLFGGWGRAATLTLGNLNDLWKYDPDTNLWTFVKGSNDYRNEFGVYSDATAANNLPGSRYSATSWTDANGDLWLLGGFGFNAAAGGQFCCLLNDLWKYDPDTNIWTFTKGSGDYHNEFGVYTNPTPANNYPGSRQRAMGWTDAAGDLWLFGGEGYVADDSGFLNDLWKYDPDSNVWAIIKGSGDYRNEDGVYTNPTPANNLSGSRLSAMVWTDANGDFWMFGGHGYNDVSTIGLLNDLWKFDTPAEPVSTTPPTITSDASAMFTVGSEGSHTVTATGSPSIMTYSITGTLPDGVDFEESTGVLSGTPEDGTAGTYQLTFTASNGVNPDDTQDFVLEVVDPTDLLTALIPTSRSPMVGSTATVFFSVANSGENTAHDVTLAMVSSKPGTFEWQTINCATAAPISAIGTAGFDVTSGQTVCTILFYTPSATFDPEQVYISASAVNAPAPATVTGLNTWLLAATDEQGPDIIGLTTTTDFFRTEAEGCTGTKNFAVGSSNVGTAVNNVVVSANTGAASLPLTISVYEMDAGTGLIIEDGSYNIIDSYGAGTNKSVLVSVQFNDCIPFDPVNKRIFIVFTEQATGRILGGTSTAVSTNR